MSFSLRACCSELLLVTCDNILAARDLAAKKWSLCAMRVCLLSNFVVFAVLAARELATRTVVFHYIPCVCVRAPVAFSSWQPATWPPRSAGVCVCHVCLSAFQFCPVCSPGRQRAGRQDAVVFHNIARLCSSCVFILAASRLAARKWGSSNCAFHVAPIPFDHPGLQ